MLRIASLKGLGWKIGVPIRVLDALAAEAHRHYQRKRKIVRGKMRIIDDPSDVLKRVQRRIYRCLFVPLASRDHIHGCVKGRSAYTNARQHLSQRYVVRLDLRDFFPSISDRRIHGLFRETLECSPDVASLLAKLTNYRGRLPQGAPTSPAIANLVLNEVDSAMLADAARASVRYTRYVDDLVFSGENAKSLLEGVGHILAGSDFSIARHKLRVQFGGYQQEVTGYTVNSPKGPSISRQRRAEVRRDIFIQSKRSGLPGGESHSQSSLEGKIRHIEATNPGAAARLRRYLDRQLAV